MKISSLLKFLTIISIFVQTTLAVDISLNGQMYRISKITYDLDYGNLSHRAILTANPWWGDASLASNAATQVKDSLGVAPYGKGPSFDYQNYSLGWNGSIIWTTLNRFWHPSSNSARDSMDGLGAQAPGHAIATALVDSDGDGVYDLDDAHPGFDDNSLEDYLTSAGYATQASYDEVVVERDARPTQASYDAMVAERDARPTQASYDAVVAEKDARPTQASYDAMVAERDARPTQASYDAVVAEKDARPTQASYDAMVAERDARPTQASYDAVVAEKDARPTQASYDAMVAERDARPTQASYDTIVAERDARPTQSSYDAVVADRDAKIQQFSTLDSRVNAILPKVVPDPPQLDLNSFNQLFDQGKQMIEESKVYAHDDYHYVDYKIGRVEGFIANGPIEDIGDELDDIISELDWSPLAHSGHYDFIPIKEKFEQAKNVYQSGNLDSFNQLFDQGKQMIEESKVYAHDDYHYVDYKIGRVEGFIANGPIEDIGDELDDIISELDWSPLAHSGHYDFIPIKEKFEQAESDFALQMGIQNAYDPTPVVTATLEEYVTSLNSDITTARQERDARLTESQVRDLRLGSSMLEVVDGDASINIELEATDNLSITSPTWTPVPESKVIVHPAFQNGKIKIDVEADDAANTGVRFYRFKMTE